jgi:basic membrane lipoprotein Med (substrate-binding protein (PBP1-ABC) superfamily)
MTNKRIVPVDGGLSRRRFLLGTGGTMAVVVSGTFVSACGDDDDDTASGGDGTGDGGTEPTSEGGGDEATGDGGGEAVKAAWVFIGPPDDKGWTQTHDDGRKFAEAALGGAATTTFTPNIGFDASTTQLFQQLVDDGNAIIFANTEYADLMGTVADANPDTKFVECNGHKFTENIFGYYMAHENAAYLLGVAAGLLAPSGKIGYIGAFPTATLFNDVNGLLLGARSVNPAATVQTVQVNTFFDPQKAASASDALLSAGVEFLFGVMDEPTFLQKAEEAGVWTGYWNLDQREAAPTKYVNNFNLDAWGPFYQEQIQAVIDGTWKAPAEAVLLECPLGEWGPEVPQEVQDAVAEAAAKLASGELAVYTGPLFDGSGTEVLAEGETLDALGAYAVDFAVEGVSITEG